jgi:acyl carrier protein
LPFSLHRVKTTIDRGMATGQALAAALGVDCTAFMEEAVGNGQGPAPQIYERQIPGGQNKASTTTQNPFSHRPGSQGSDGVVARRREGGPRECELASEEEKEEVRFGYQEVSVSISSRTPKGTPNRCLVCGHALRIEPTQSFGDVPCPACGTLLWFVTDGEGMRLFGPREARLIELLAIQLGVNPDRLRAGRLDELGMDSLDVAELIMALEEQFPDN